MYGTSIGRDGRDLTESALRPGRDGRPSVYAGTSIGGDGHDFTESAPRLGRDGRPSEYAGTSIGGDRRLGGRDAGGAVSVSAMIGGLRREP